MISEVEDWWICLCDHHQLILLVELILLIFGMPREPSQFESYACLKMKHPSWWELCLVLWSILGTWWFRNRCSRYWFLWGVWLGSLWEIYLIHRGAPRCSSMDRSSQRLPSHAYCTFHKAQGKTQEKMVRMFCGKLLVFFLYNYSSRSKSSHHSDLSFLILSMGEGRSDAMRETLRVYSCKCFKGTSVAIV